MHVTKIDANGEPCVGVQDGDEYMLGITAREYAVIAEALDAIRPELQDKVASMERLKALQMIAEVIGVNKRIPPQAQELFDAVRRLHREVEALYAALNAKDRPQLEDLRVIQAAKEASTWTGQY